MKEMPTEKEKKALVALNLLIPLLTKRNFRWCITGGFACCVYGVKRELTDIDVDIETTRESPSFQGLVSELTPYITQPLEHFVDKNYDNYNFEITIEGQVIDICPMTEMKVFNKKEGIYECFYQAGFPTIETVDFFGLKVPLLSKKLIIKNKEMLVWQRESDLRDIEALKELVIGKR